MLSRRRLIELLGAATLAGKATPAAAAAALTHRTLGRTGRWVTPYGLGGQASLQYPSSTAESTDIVVRAIELGITYLDTANAYGTSQSFYGQAFWKLAITPGHPDHDPAQRSRLYVASKTGQRFAFDKAQRNYASAIDELKRSLTVMFGDGKGWIPDDAYLDCIQIHNLTAPSQVDQIYAALDARGGKMPDQIGALAGLLDYRDGTNYTGLNPEGRRYVRHIGITGHQNSSVLMNAIQRDDLNILDTLLVAVNANDRQYQSHQYNAVPAARAKGMGIIAMKLFSAGGIYSGLQRQPANASELIRSVGVQGGVPSSDLIRYPLSVPGVSTAIVGVSHIDRESPENDQLASNLAAAMMDSTSDAERLRIESAIAERHGTKTNYFQDATRVITQPPAPKTESDGERVWIRWTSALAAGDPIRSYMIWVDNRRIAWVPYRPQLTTTGLSLPVPRDLMGSGNVRIEASTDLPPW